VDVYTVSQEHAGIYRSDRHLHANFNRTKFVQQLVDEFGVAFEQIILDYFWIPAGWDNHHWSPSFFEKTLIEFAKNNLLAQTSSTCKVGRPGIYLPFCLHNFKEVLAAFEKIRNWYNVRFLRKSELQEIALWVGTQNIPSYKMQSILGKRGDQEEVYCTFDSKEIQSMMNDHRISKQQLMEIASCLDDFGNIRFIVLEPKSCSGLGCILGLQGNPTISYCDSSDWSVPTVPVTPTKRNISVALHECPTDDHTTSVRQSKQNRNRKAKIVTPQHSRRNSSDPGLGEYKLATFKKNRLPPRAQFPKVG
jgi:hypothetical protein